jgi:hypothetical protein
MSETSPEFRTIVEQRLQGLKLPRREEIARELADDLEDRFEALLTQGMSRDEAAAEALRQAGDWTLLQQGIQRESEGDMAHRVKTFWIPALLALTLVSLGEKLLWALGVHPAVSFGYFSYMATNPWMQGCYFVVGTATALISQALGGSRFTRALAAIAPALCSMAFLLFAALFGLVMALATHRGAFAANPRDILLLLFFDVFFPALLLFCGALPFVVWNGQRCQPQPPAIA